LLLAIFSSAATRICTDRAPFASPRPAIRYSQPGLGGASWEREKQQGSRQAGHCHASPA
jgi:hypothetical protein